MKEKRTIIPPGYKYGKSYEHLYSSIRQALEGKVVMYAHIDGNVAIINWQEYERLKKLDFTPPPQHKE